MGIGRREFLIQFGSALAVLASTSGAAAAALEDLYVNRRHGIAFRKPRDWEFQDIRDIGKTKAGMLLESDGFDPDAWAEFLRNDQTYEAFVVAADMRCARYFRIPGSSDRESIAPGFSVSYEGTWEQDGPDPGAPVSLADFVTRDLELFAQAYREFRLLQSPGAVEISGCGAIEYIARYLYAHAHLPHPVPMRERVLYIYQGPAIYSVRMFDYPEVDPTLSCDFAPFLATLRIL